jgi:DNA-binding transcriptional ArsR family regulator
MLNYQAHFDGIFHALADPSRRLMVERLASGPASVGELAKPLTMSLPSVVQHLGVLEACGLVTSEKIGRVRVCRLDTDVLRAAEQWISERRSLMEKNFDRLGAYLESTGPDAMKEKTNE